MAFCHVIPLEDSREHEVSPDCECHPTDAQGVLVHHAWDCREKWERQEVETGKRWGVFEDP